MKGPTLINKIIIHWSEEWKGDEEFWLDIHEIKVKTIWTRKQVLSNLRRLVYKLFLIYFFLFNLGNLFS
jgi:hypothetical protein